MTERGRTATVGKGIEVFSEVQTMTSAHYATRLIGGGRRAYGDSVNRQLTELVP